MISLLLVLLLLVLLFLFLLLIMLKLRNDLASENINKDKSILEAPPKQDKKEVKNPRAKKTNSQKPK